MRPHPIFAALMCALGLAACGSGASSAPSSSSNTAPITVTRTVTPTSSSTPTSATSSSSSTTTSSTSAAPAAAGGQCVAADLSLSFLGGQGATGHGELGFALRNTSAASCRTGGYPGVLFLDDAGSGLPTTPTHTTDDFFGHTVLRQLTVAPGASVSFRLGVSHVASGGSDGGCVTATGIQAIAPNDTATLHVTVPGGIAECGGTVTVSPLQSGDAALR